MSLSGLNRDTYRTGRSILVNVSDEIYLYPMHFASVIFQLECIEPELDSVL